MTCPTNNTPIVAPLRRHEDPARQAVWLDGVEDSIAAGQAVAGGIDDMLTGRCEP